MAELARAGAAPLIRGLPDEVWEILVLLGPNSLLRCRACRRAYSTRRLLLAHHARQPDLPIINGFNIFRNGGKFLGIVPFDHRAADQLQPVARLDADDFSIDADLLTCGPSSVLFRGNLHWHSMEDEGESSVIMVFDTTAESLWLMRAPEDLSRVELFETDGRLGISSLTDAATATSIDIWLMQDYETEVWALKYRVELQIHNF